MKWREYDKGYPLRINRDRIKLARHQAYFVCKRITLTAAIFVTAVYGFAFSSILTSDAVSVEFPVINIETDGKQQSIIEYGCTEQVQKIAESVKKKKDYVFLTAAIGWTNAGRSASFKSTDYSYTGSSEWVDDGLVAGARCFRIKFKTSGTFTPKKRVVIDVFLVGGGGGGAGNGHPDLQSIGPGGGGGYTGTWRKITLNANQAYAITIGAGGSPSSGGGSTSAFGYSVGGGYGAVKLASYYAIAPGAHGGSGGGANGRAGVNTRGGNGGSDGSNGEAIYAAGGAGQGTTTREFGEADATLYSGGGGGGADSNSLAAGIGGAGGGGRGYGSPGGGPTAGTANTGGGGGGGAGGANYYGAAGGSGICVIRNAR